MTIRKITTDMRFKDNKGIYGFTKNIFALYVEGKGFVSLDGISIYTAIGGRKALQNIIDMGGFTEEPYYINPINNL